MGQSPSRIWASKPASERRALRLAQHVTARFVIVGCAFWSSACRGEYTQPPTACDDYCRAVERANCSEDYPADCVRDCEKSRPSPAKCATTWQALDDCYGATDASAFICVDNHSQPTSVCLPERRTVTECLAPGSGPCFDECVRQVETCGATLSDCESNCRAPAPGCASTANVFYACLQKYPTECHAWGEPDPRTADQILLLRSARRLGLRPMIGVPRQAALVCRSSRHVAEHS